ncbi:hypothetical protein [Burkholderia latens]|uniref:Uncharacterized protein n=1 Tax=Burkholderia latens TaxID=488446 RepID=A0A6H9T702_9BURK|nr:hypothetical protein [Burkholderia latens]KAB0634630.1 hypothetical protein F7R21_25765 [Burkholderia latens]VWB09415.1 hypothetical protein BLA24064_00259 [Burkholderia latens]
MFFPSFALRLKRLALVAGDRSVVSVLSLLARACGNRCGTTLGHLPSRPLPRPLDCALVGAMAAAVALVALLCAAASRVGFAHVWRIGGWLP